MKLDIFKEFNKRPHPYEQYSQQDVINLYIEANKDGKSPKAFYLRPGLKEAATLPGGQEVRKAVVNGDTAYIVSGSQLFSADTALSFTNLNSESLFDTESGRMDMSVNQNNQVFMTDGARGYVYDEDSATFDEVTDSAFPVNPVGSAYFYGHSVTGKSGTNEIYLSQANDALTWNQDEEPIRFNMIYRKDTIQQIRVLAQQIYFFGEYVTEVWYNPGVPGPIPFRRNTNQSFEYGTPAPESVVSSHGVMVFLAQSRDGHPGVMLTRGGQLKKLSNLAVDDAIAGYETISDARAFIYKIDSEVFYNLTFPSENKTWVCNLASQTWTRYESEKDGRFRPNMHFYFSNRHLVGDYESGKLFELSKNSYSDDGHLFRWLITTGHIYDDNDYKRMQINELILDMVKGRVEINEPSPEIYLYVSTNGGISFRKPKIRRQTGIGEYRRRLIFYTLGISRDFVLKIEGYNSLPQAIMGCTAQAEKLSL